MEEDSVKNSQPVQELLKQSLDQHYNGRETLYGAKDTTVVNAVMSGNSDASIRLVGFDFDNKISERDAVAARDALALSTLAGPSGNVAYALMLSGIRADMPNSQGKTAIEMTEQYLGRDRALEITSMQRYADQKRAMERQVTIDSLKRSLDQHYNGRETLYGAKDTTVVNAVMSGNSDASIRLVGFDFDNKISERDAVAARDALALSTLAGPSGNVAHALMRSGIRADMPNSQGKTAIEMTEQYLGRDRALEITSMQRYVDQEHEIREAARGTQGAGVVVDTSSRSTTTSGRSSAILDFREVPAQVISAPLETQHAILPSSLELKTPIGSLALPSAQGEVSSNLSALSIPDIVQNASSQIALASAVGHVMSKAAQSLYSFFNNETTTHSAAINLETKDMDKKLLSLGEQFRELHNKRVTKYTESPSEGLLEEINNLKALQDKATLTLERLENFNKLDKDSNKEDLQREANKIWKSYKKLEEAKKVINVQSVAAVRKVVDELKSAGVTQSERTNTATPMKVDKTGRSIN